MRPKFFKSPGDLREWLEKHHASAAELLAGFYKVSTGKPSVTYHEALDQALCFGWIDGVRRSLGDESYTIRFTPRRPGSYWSLVNIKRAEALIEHGLMTAAGLREFEKRDEQKARRYSNEAKSTDLSAAYEREFRANKRAWAYWQKQRPSYRKPASFWVMSAKREETRQRRLNTLINDSANERWVKPLTPPSKKQ